MKAQLGIVSLICAAATTSFAQSDQACLQSFAVKPDRSVGYIAVDTTGQFKVIEPMKCPDAERFRERIFLSTNEKLFDSEQTLLAVLAAAEQSLNALEMRLKESNDKAQIKSSILGTVVVVNSTWAIATIASCGSGLVNGAGLAACGPAIRAAAASSVAWYALVDYVGSAAEMKAAALSLVAEQRQTTVGLRKSLDTVRAANMKENRSGLFLAVCHAVKQQCM